MQSTCFLWGLGVCLAREPTYQLSEDTLGVSV